MFFVLLTLLAIALTLVLAGLFLTPRSQAQVPEQQTISYAARSETRARAYRSVSSQRISPDYAYKPERQVRLQRTVNVSRYDTYSTYESAPAPSNWSHLVSLLNIKQLVSPRIGEPTPWLGVCLILIALFGVCMISLQPLLFSHTNTIQAFWPLPQSSDTAPTPASVSKPAPASDAPMFAGLAGASKAVVRVNQMIPEQYASVNEFNNWGPSTCSTAAMTEVINAYAHKNYRITDILKVEADVHAITPDLGLLEPSGIDRTVDKFGFKAVHLDNPSLDEVIKIANEGRPVIVGFPPPRVEGGHILVLRGGNADQVYLADSSVLNQTVMTRSKFLYLWGGFSVVVVPK